MRSKTSSVLIAFMRVVCAQDTNIIRYWEYKITNRFITCEDEPIVDQDTPLDGTPVHLSREKRARDCLGVLKESLVIRPIICHALVEVVCPGPCARRSVLPSKGFVFNDCFPILKNCRLFLRLKIVLKKPMDADNQQPSKKLKE